MARIFPHYSLLNDIHLIKILPLRLNNKDPAPKRKNSIMVRFLISSESVL